MLTVEQALQQIVSRVEVLPAERVALLDALDRVLAEPVVATREIPPWPNSSMDGYAVRSADTRAGSARLALVGRVAAGSMPEAPVGRGQAARIFTGAPLPDGADAVIPQEDVRVDGDSIAIAHSVEAGAFVRPRGEDVRPGDAVLAPGQVIGPAEVGLLATLGRPQVLVHRRPRVAILSTGDELADLGSEPGPGQIPNTNTYSLMGQAVAAGGEVVNLGVAGDRLEEIEARLRAIDHADVLVSSAGVSVGDHDLVRAALERLGAELHLWQVAMRPGKPITFGSIRGRPLFGLPGNPVSAMVTFELFVRPALRKMMGHTVLDRPRLVARAGQPIANPGPRRAYLRVTLTPDGRQYTARLTGEQGSAILRSMVLADGFAVLAGDARAEEGEDLEVIVLKPLTPLPL
jgi:molybdopterin molybdotransferase